MLYLQNLGRTIGDRRNWPALIMAGALTFLGAQLLDLFGLDSALWMFPVIALAALAARPFLKI